MAKIGRNDLCPCGSGKKYKNCCGRSGIDFGSLLKVAPDIRPSDLVLEDFVIDRLSEDISFMASAVKIMLGPDGYNRCQRDKDEIVKALNGDPRDRLFADDYFGIYSEASSTKATIERVMPYSGGAPDLNNDIVSLCRKGFISSNLQVDVLHEYLMHNLKKRFRDYYYIPSRSVLEKESLNRRSYGPFARRGYDFLLGITLYLELQLGVHVFYELTLPKEGPGENVNAPIKEAVRKFFGLESADDLTNGIARLLIGYVDVIMSVSKEYDAAQEVESYHLAGAYTEEEYLERKEFIKPGFYKKPLDYNYIGYLMGVVMATVTNISANYLQATMAFPQCDFIRYLEGLEKVLELFEDKLPGKTVSDADIPDFIREQMDDPDRKIEDIHISRKEIYDETVFLWMDEQDSSVNHIKPQELIYIDFPEKITDDESKEHDGMHDVNPARKTTSVRQRRKLRMDLFNLLNGKCFVLEEGDAPGSKDNMKCVGKYPVLPWLGNGEEDTVHVKAFDRHAMDLDQLMSADLSQRQEFLTMEYRLTSIPANSIDRYLDPEAFMTWEERNDLLVKLEERNRQLEETNENLKKQLDTNQKLVRNIAHSAANYLNSERLEKTGVVLHGADVGDPPIEQLHSDGLFLMLQSEQERYLTRQLRLLVDKYQSDLTEKERKEREDALEQQMRGSISSHDGLTISEIADFAVKTVAARILFSTSDSKGKQIRSKLGKSDVEWTNLTSTFVTDVLAAEGAGSALSWWNDNWGRLDITITDRWERIRAARSGVFFDTIAGIITELLVNAMAHGRIADGIDLTLAQEMNDRGRPATAFILCRNHIDPDEEGQGAGAGLSSLENDVKILNHGKKSLECTSADGVFETRILLDKKLLNPSSSSKEG